MPVQEDKAILYLCIPGNHGRFNNADLTHRGEYLHIFGAGAYHAGDMLERDDPMQWDIDHFRIKPKSDTCFGAALPVRLVHAHALARIRSESCLGKVASS